MPGAGSAQGQARAGIKLGLKVKLGLIDRGEEVGEMLGHVMRVLVDCLGK